MVGIFIFQPIPNGLATNRQIAAFVFKVFAAILPHGLNLLPAHAFNRSPLSADNSPRG